MVKVYHMNDCEWFAGEDLESCIKYYFEEYIGEDDTPENREEYLNDAEELSEAEMDRLKFTDIEGEWGERDKQYTFREALDKMIAEGTEFPCFFASTEF
jgi:hypothetical protein